MKKVEIYKVTKECPGGFHSWVLSSVGKIRKENKNLKIEQKPSFSLIAWILALIRKIALKLNAWLPGRAS